jgi:hypothetical protein
VIRIPGGLSYYPDRTVANFTAQRVGHVAHGEILS